MIKCCQCQQFIKHDSKDYYEFTPFGGYGDLQPAEQYIHVYCWEELDYQEKKLRINLMYQKGSVPDIV